jgi:hypothetical protein
MAASLLIERVIDISLCHRHPMTSIRAFNLLQTTLHVRPGH